MARILLALGIGSWVALVAARAEDPAFAREDPAKIMGVEACGECHVAEYEVWKKTPHATGFKTLHREPQAEAIAGRLGVRLIKRDSPCIACHYTPIVEDAEPRARSGVSCELCHGAGRDWINVHNTYGGKGFTHDNESPEHRQERIAKSRENGMRRPSDLYPVVRSCFGCHTVPEERLVNVGGHSTGSPNFELVEWSQGDIRHNFLASFLQGDGTENAPRDEAQKRRMYVVGRALALEYALRGTAAASEEGVYLKAMIRRTRGALSELRAIAERADLPTVDAMLAAVRGVKVGLDNRDALLRTADEVAVATQGFLKRHDGQLLASLDPLVLGTAEPLEDVEDEDASEETVASGGDTSGDEPSATPSSASPAASTKSAPAANAAIPAVGELKRKIRPKSEFDTLGPGACSGCHTPQNQWWYSDPHFRSADPFYDQAPENVKIARLYGVGTSKMTRGDQVCMDCHGTIVSGRETRGVQDGVSCESCHGAAAGYLKPHQEGDKSLGTKRPGYVRGLELGKAELLNLDVRAATCTGCHYVTEPRLISAGHPSGAGWNYAEAMTKIRHWERTEAPAEIEAAFAKALAKRGAVPDVQRARLAGPAVETASSRPVSPTELAEKLGPRPQGPVRTSDGTSSAPPPSTPTVVGDALLPPFPEVDPKASVEEVLELVKKRFELLYQALHKGGEKP